MTHDPETPDLVWRASQHHGHIVDHVLHHEETLRHTETPEGCVGGQVGSAGGTAASQVGDVVSMVHMKEDFFNYLQEKIIITLPRQNADAI